MKTWLTVVDAADYSGLSRDTIYTACERRELHHVRVGGRRTIRLKAEWIDEWLERHARGAESPLGTTIKSVTERAQYPDVDRAQLRAGDQPKSTNGAALAGLHRCRHAQ